MIKLTMFTEQGTKNVWRITMHILDRINNTIRCHLTGYESEDTIGLEEGYTKAFDMPASGDLAVDNDIASDYNYVMGLQEFKNGIKI